MFSLAQDGEREAVFDVDEFFLGELDGGLMALRLVSDPNVTAIGHVREISPAVDPKSSTVRVKVTIHNSSGGHDAWERGCGHQDIEVCRTDHRAMDRDDGLGGQSPPSGPSTRRP